MLINCHSYYSLRYGTYSEKELLRLAELYNYKTVALTDINNTSACLSFIRNAKALNIKPVVGIDFRNGAQQEFVALAKNNKGFHEINHFLSFHLHEKKAIPELAPQFKDVYIIYPFEKLLLLDKREFSDNEFIGVELKDLRKIQFSEYFDLKEKMVILHSVTFRNKKDFNIHRLFRAIDNNILLSKLPKTEEALDSHKMFDIENLQAYYKDFPFIIKNTEAILANCTIDFDFSDKRKHQNKLKYGASADEDEKQLRQLCEKGLKYRYKKVTPEITARIEKELGLIKKMDFIPFFLVNWDIIEYAQRKGYFHIGRGSGANSIVAYLLGITDVDPIDLDLYFERFMNLYRVNPPDFDIDFSWRDREDVTRYIFERFGDSRQVSLLATYNTFKHKAAVREIGKVFGLPKAEIDRLSTKKYDLNTLDQFSLLVHKYALYIQGMPNYLSVHAGGVLISEKPIHYFSATFLPPKGFPVAQFDMHVAEDVGLYKYDILGQRGLGKIKDALQLVYKNNKGIAPIDIHDVQRFIKDEKVNKMVSEAACIGCFYVESPAMRMLLKKLSVDNYLGLVAASSIIRPGVAKSGMMREYILRHKDVERRKLAHPVLWELMKETYGIMVYQEDVIKVAHHFAGLDLGKADVLRRGMSGKFRSREEFQSVKDEFINNCKEKGYANEMVQEIWTQVESFAGYAFAKGHSASYAIESYQSLYLKCYYPLEYMVAVLNNGGGFYSTEMYIHETRQLGGNVHPPCVNNSEYETTIQGKDIYLGFQLLHGLDYKVALKIIAERAKNGDYQSLNDFINRVIVGVESLETLIRINAFRFTKINKRKLLWEALLKVNKKVTNTTQQKLFYPETKNFVLPDLSLTALENIKDDIEILGFPQCNPFSLLKEKPSAYFLAKHLKDYINKSIIVYGYLVTIKTTKTSNNKYMYFGTFIDKEGFWLDTVHFPPVASKYPFRGKGIYKMCAKVVSEFDFLSLEVLQMEKMPYVNFGED
jgi:DNA-directed DNA polymerase III PolC